MLFSINVSLGDCSCRLRFLPVYVWSGWAGHGGHFLDFCNSEISSSVTWPCSGFSMALTARYNGEYGLCPAPALNMSTASPVHDLLITSPLSPTGTPTPIHRTDNPLPPRQATPKTMELSKPSFVVPPPRTLATQSIYATPTSSSIPFLSLSPSTDRHTPPAPVADRPTDRPTASKSLQRAFPLPPFPVLGCVCVCVCE